MMTPKHEGSDRLFVRIWLDSLDKRTPYPSTSGLNAPLIFGSDKASNRIVNEFTFNSNSQRSPSVWFEFEARIVDMVRKQ